MYCSECGKPVDDGAKFCGECGAKVNMEGTVPATFPTSPRPAKPSLSAAGEIFASKTETSSSAADQSAAESVPTRTGQGVSLAGLALALLSIFLPWFEVSCGGMRVEIEGGRIITGTVRAKLEGTLASGNESPSLLALSWLGLLIVATVIVVGVSDRDTAGGSGLLLAGLAGIFLLIFCLSTIEDANKASQQNMGALQFKWAAGFWMACVGTILVGVGAFLRKTDTG